MDKKLSKAVRHLFVDLYKKGLIYRGERLVNWDTKLKTALSDDEVVSQEVQGHLWHYRYPIKDSEEYVTIATTRPETMFGDMAIAVNPEDSRYQHLVGKEAIIPFTERNIPIIADDYVKKEFGTGCVKITPAHDPNDFAMGKRHGLTFLNIMNENGTLNESVPESFRGLDRFEARKRIIKKLKELDLFEQQEKNRHSVPTSDRSKTIIEPRLSKQWYVNMQTFAEPAIQYAKSGELNFYPNQWKKTYYHWLENIQDWCISRQLWWGHRIPIWYCDDCSGISCEEQDPTACSHCGSDKIEQDQDVLDTWFSSWLWPLSPFGWPEETEDLKRYFPSNVLVTGADILYLWVARMIMVSHYAKGALPFKDVYFNSIICDKSGQKFSKTLGNGIDPLEIIEKHGADAVRYTCISLAPLGGRVKMAVEDFDIGARFVNKLWNSARFLQGRLSEGFVPKALETCTLDLPMKWLLTRLKRTTVEMNALLEKYQVNEAAELLFHFVWREYCDWGLEAAKVSIQQNPDLADDTHSALLFVFEGLLRLAAPFIPFVTEEIWRSMPRHSTWDSSSCLAGASYPSLHKLPEFGEAEQNWEILREFVGGIRSIRSQAQVPPKEPVEITVECSETVEKVIKATETWIHGLCNSASITTGEKIDSKPARSMVAVGQNWSAYIPVEKYLDIDKEIGRLESELRRLSKIVAGLEGKLSSKNFVERAPSEIVESTKGQLKNTLKSNFHHKET